MKKVFLFVCMVAISVCLASVSSAASLFSEDWETGAIDPLKWTAAGNPVPEVVTSGYSSNYSLDVNGDITCDSGVYTVDEFSTATDLKAVFWMQGTSVTNTSGMSITAGFTTADSAIGCDAEGYFSTIASIQLISIRFGKGIYYRTNNGGFFTESYVDDNWHEYAIELLPDGTVNFYRDGVLKYAAPAVSLDSYPTTRFQAVGKAAYGPMLIDTIDISTGGITCVSDFNKDGVVDDLDLNDRVESDITAFVAWMTICWNAGLPCGDYNGDGEFTNQDLILKGLDMIKNLAEWVFTCWIPATELKTTESIATGIAHIDKFEKLISAAIRATIH
ncbi:MAG: hypothetical protein WA151_17530 [Desulfatirhabdiaceae bacterium]